MRLDTAFDGFVALSGQMQTPGELKMGESGHVRATVGREKTRRSSVFICDQNLAGLDRWLAPPSRFACEPQAGI
jgi:hypothetical protein